jgi:hypothetical protein
MVFLKTLVPTAEGTFGDVLSPAFNTKVIKFFLSFKTVSGSVTNTMMEVSGTKLSYE